MNRIFRLAIPMKDKTIQSLSVTRQDIAKWLTERSKTRLIDDDDEKLVSNFKRAYKNEYNKTHKAEDDRPKGTIGGKREGAGRKPKSDNGQRIGFRCSQDVWDILQEKDDKTAYIEAAIREKHRRESWK